MAKMVWLTWFALLVACLGFLPHHAAGEEKKDEEKNLALHFISSYGVEAKLPFFEDYYEADDELRHVVNIQLTHIFNYLNKTLGEMLVGEHAGKISRLQSMRVTGNLVKKGYNFISERKKLKRPSGTTPQFNNVMKHMFHNILKGSTLIEKELKSRNEAKDPVRLERRKTKLFGTIIEALNHPDNKVSFYFDWIGATLLDREVSPEPQPLEKELTDVVGHLRYQGFGGVMSTIESLVNLFFMWSGKGWN